MKKVWIWFDGKKSLISAMIMLIVNSDYIEGLFVDAQLYLMVQGIAALMFVGGMVHKGVKAVKK